MKRTVFALFFCLLACTPEKPQHRSSVRRDALSTGVVISEVYGGAGSGTPTYRHDFIELFNRGTTAVDVSNWSVQYASATASTWSVTPLTSVTLLPGQYYLVQESSGGSSGVVLSAPDATGTIAMAAGMLPITIGLHGDNAFRAPMGASVIGGLLVSTALSLFVVPVIYTLFDGLEQRMKRLVRRLKGEVTETSTPAGPESAGAA